MVLNLKNWTQRKKANILGTTYESIQGYYKLGIIMWTRILLLCAQKFRPTRVVGCCLFTCHRTYVIVFYKYLSPSLVPSRQGMQIVWGVIHIINRPVLVKG